MSLLNWAKESGFIVESNADVMTAAAEAGDIQVVHACFSVTYVNTMLFS